MGKTIITITHTNYTIKSSGTEKCVMEISTILRKNGYRHLNFFAFYNNDRLFGEKLVGVNLDDNFIGIYKYSYMLDLVDYFSQKYHLDYVTIQLQHLMNHNIDIIKDLIFKLEINVLVYFHDFYNVCGQTNFMKNGSVYCGTESPSFKKCKDCVFFTNRPKFFHDFERFLNEISPFLQYMIAPSDYVSGVLKNLYTEHAYRIITRPHLKLGGNAEYSKIDMPLNIVFCGAQIQHKGYFEWKSLVNRLAIQSEGSYKFYYLGVGKEEVSHVTNIYTSISEQGSDAMIRLLKKIEAHVVFLWSNCPETYSYVYYENSVNGVFVITNNNSGNVSSEVTKNGNGIVFHSFDDAVNWLLNKDLVLDLINLYRTAGKFRPNSIEVNFNPELLISEGTIYQYKKQTKKLKVEKVAIPQLVYRLKYGKELKKQEKGIKFVRDDT